MIKNAIYFIVGLYILVATAFVGYLYSFKTNELSKATQLGANQSATQMQTAIINQIKTTGYLPLNIDGQTVNLVPYVGTTTTTK